MIYDLIDFSVEQNQPRGGERTLRTE